MEKEGNMLKDSPEYEEYTVNEAKLSIEELKMLGMLKCSGSCCKQGKGKEEGTLTEEKCNGGGCCCKQKGIEIVEKS